LVFFGENIDKFFTLGVHAAKFLTISSVAKCVSLLPTEERNEEGERERVEGGGGRWEKRPQSRSMSNKRKEYAV
jgi:hypothetical protein